MPLPVASERGKMPEPLDQHSTDEWIRVGTPEELKARGMTVVHGGSCPFLVVHDRGKFFALDNRCPHLGFPLHRGSVEDGILTCHWHHARFDLASGCTFDLWADDVPHYEVVVREGTVYVDGGNVSTDSRIRYRRRLKEGLEHDVDLIQAK